MNELDKIYYKPFRKKSILRQVVYFIEAVGAVLLFCFLWLLPLDFSSWLGGKIARFIGICSKENKVALMNLQLAFPEKTEQERKKIAALSWENFGRTIAEYTHLSKNDTLNKRINIVNEEYFTSFLNAGKGGFILSGHYGNWEIGSCVATKFHRSFNSVYRRPNNPFLQKLFLLRKGKVAGEMIAKDDNSLLKMMRLIGKKEIVALLIDQKLNEGIPVDFFGVPAMTTPVPAIVSKRYGSPIIFVQVERINNSANFNLICHKPMLFEKGHPTKEEIANITSEINKMLEKAVREKPEMWLWIHKRWTKQEVEDALKQREAKQKEEKL